MSMLDHLRQDDSDGHYPTVCYNEALDDVREALLAELYRLARIYRHSSNPDLAALVLDGVRRWAGGDQ